MKQHLVRLGALGCLVALTGCGTIIQKAIRNIDQATEGVTGAEPLDTTKLLTDANGTDPVKKKSALLQLAAQSYQACDNYKRILLLGSRGSNFLFDTAATTFSTLGTVFTHVDVIHGFTAATAITTGTKTALDADIYQNATAPLMVAAINQTYGSHMAQFVASLEGSSSGAANQPPAEKSAQTNPAPAPADKSAQANSAPAPADKSAQANPAPAPADKSAQTNPAPAPADKSAPANSVSAPADKSAQANSVSATPGSDTPSGTEYTDLVRIHTECSLTEAMAEIQTLQQAQTSAPSSSLSLHNAFNADVLSLTKAKLSPAQITSLESSMGVVNLTPTNKGTLATDQLQLVTWANSAPDAQVQTMDAAVKTLAAGGT